jgi:hypothetical protein
MPGITQIEITKNQADAIRADIIEINQLQEVLRLKMTHNKRMTDMIVRDAGKKPEEFATYELKDDGGKTMMVLTHMPDKEPIPAPSGPQPVPANPAKKR